ncbi:MAG: hypothetical protein QM632_06275 [Micrococcaceae bacterium]
MGGITKMMSRYRPRRPSDKVSFPTSRAEYTQAKRDEEVRIWPFGKFIEFDWAHFEHTGLKRYITTVDVVTKRHIEYPEEWFDENGKPIPLAQRKDPYSKELVRIQEKYPHPEQWFDADAEYDALFEKYLPIFKTRD